MRAISTTLARGLPAGLICGAALWASAGTAPAAAQGAEALELAAVPRGAADSLPRPLSAADAAHYRRIFDAQDRGESRGFRWRGVWYSDLARCVRRFSAESTRADWDEFYHDVLGVSASWPTLARRRGSVAAELAAAAT